MSSPLSGSKRKTMEISDDFVDVGNGSDDSDPKLLSDELKNDDNDEKNIGTNDKKEELTITDYKKMYDDIVIQKKEADDQISKLAEKEKELNDQKIKLQLEINKAKTVAEWSIALDNPVVGIYTPSIFTTPPVSNKTSKTTILCRWYFEDDNGGWSGVTQDWNDIVNKRLSPKIAEKGDHQNFSVTVGKFNYDIEMDGWNGVQINTSTNKRRQIKCEKENKTVTAGKAGEYSPTKNIDIPSVVFDETVIKALRKKITDPVTVESVLNTTDEYKEIEGRFMHIGYDGNQSMSSMNAKIVGIERVISPKVARKYLFAKSLLSTKTERLLFHGCKNRNVFNDIYENGLDSRVAASSGLLGNGIYLGDSPYYPNAEFTVADSNGIKKLFIVACLVGREYDAGDVFHAGSSTRYIFNALKKANVSGVPYDSIRSTTTDNNCGIYCVYDNTQCCVTHVVSYKV